MGRRLLYDPEPVASFTMNVRESADEALRALAKERGRPKTRIVADLVEAYLAEQIDGFEPVLRPDQPDDAQDGLDFEDAA